jgi:hypothetical protein
MTLDNVHSLQFVIVLCVCVLSLFSLSVSYLSFRLYLCTSVSLSTVYISPSLRWQLLVLLTSVLLLNARLGANNIHMASLHDLKRTLMEVQIYFAGDVAFQERKEYVYICVCLLYICVYVCVCVCVYVCKCHLPVSLQISAPTSPTHHH